MACICLLLVILGLSGSIAYNQHNSKKPTRPSTTTISPNTTAGGANTTTSTSSITNQTVQETMPELAVSKLGDYTMLASEEGGVVSLEMGKCENCTKILFNKTQIAEINKFIMACDGTAGCPIKEWPNHTGFCIVCDPVVRMRTSKLHLCINYHRTLSSGFIDNYTLNYDTLQLLSAADAIVNKVTI